MPLPTDPQLQAMPFEELMALYRSAPPFATGDWIRVAKELRHRKRHQQAPHTDRPRLRTTIRQER